VYSLTRRSEVRFRGQTGRHLLSLSFTGFDLFPGYAFVVIELQWLAARWCPGVVRLVMDGIQPARVRDDVIAAIRDRERNGVIELPRRLIKAGDRVRLLAGPFQGHLAIYTGMSGSERVAVLLHILGGHQRVTLSTRDIEALT
jgi:transcriptional antiterminator RfaH